MSSKVSKTVADVVLQVCRVWVGICCMAWCTCLNVSAQNSANKNAISFKFLTTDYNTLDPAYRLASPTRYFHPDDINYAAELGYFRYLNSSVNLGAVVRIGSIDAYHYLIDPNDPACDSTPCNKRYFRDEFFTNLDIVGTYKFNNGYLLQEDYILAPYLILGMGLTYMQHREGHLDLQIPMGVGLNIRFNPMFHLQLQGEYRQSLLINKPNIALSLGFAWTLGRKKEKTEPTPISVDVSDRDMDGVMDADDDCPDESGVVELKGCPDSDADNIADRDDDCPKVKGIAAFKGCPDTDSDGLKDTDDDCPELAGPIDNKGCPLEVAQEDKDLLANATYGINFETGNAVIKESSFEILDKIADLMRRYPNHKLKIQGHTDNTGGATQNLMLSKDRAQACLDYLTKKGVDADRLEPKGYGETQPVETNDTAEGRAKNRRVVFILY